MDNYEMAHALPDALPPPLVELTVTAVGSVARLRDAVERDCPVMPELTAEVPVEWQRSLNRLADLHRQIDNAFYDVIHQRRGGTT